MRVHLDGTQHWTGRTHWTGLEQVTSCPTIQSPELIILSRSMRVRGLKRICMGSVAGAGVVLESGGESGMSSSHAVRC